MIAPMTLKQLQDRCGGELVGEDLAFSSVCIDTRKVATNDLFVALEGENFDAHDFIEQIEALGAAFVLNRNVEGLSKAHLLVDDTRAALGHIAGFCRDQFEHPVIAITGSSGKTTARNMLSAILSLRGEVCTTLANQNNEIGVPLTLLSLEKKQVAAVVELGARHCGDISYLGQFVNPDIAILLNAGSAHIGEFGGYDNLVKAKGEIYKTLKQGGLAIVNLDDGAHDSWLNEITGKRVLTYSANDSVADVYCSEVNNQSAGARFNLHYQDRTQTVSLPVPGVHNISNALAAASAAISLGYSLGEVAEGLLAYQAETGRLTRKALSESLMLIDDSYNANPASMVAAIDVLALESGLTIAVLGEMGELGADEERLHREVAKHAASSDIDEFWLIGRFAQAMSDVIGERARVFCTKEEIALAMSQIENEPTTVLLKASRFVALEGVIELYMRGSD